MLSKSGRRGCRPFLSWHNRGNTEELEMQLSTVKLPVAVAVKFVRWKGHQERTQLRSRHTDCDERIATAAVLRSGA